MGYIMIKRIHPHHPDIDGNMWEKIDTIIEAGRGEPGALITVLRECQDVVRYLPRELLSYVSSGLNLPVSQVFGVATFYSFFSLTPKGRHTIKACTGTACYVKGIKESLNRIHGKYNLKEGGTTEDRRFSLEGVRCLGACGLAPVMVVDKDVHGAVSSDKVIQILENYK
ncbi:NADH dehydrogenase subunit E [Desulfocicer vacuolatum DSM 3385]|uniref:NADH dehydrogenase subunit E n=2 Tax=Desulfocicer vacuolatum TaxID=2298 RepID=A0A1W1YLJ2_9BACT|nr:NADH dehydrogenase subunit E [Desulfocicer vacuolatum DSM 3385]